MSQDTLFWIAAVLTPLTGGLLRYSVSYGYEGNDRAYAWGQACGVATILTVVVCLFVAVRQ